MSHHLCSPVVQQQDFCFWSAPKLFSFGGSKHPLHTHPSLGCSETKMVCDLFSGFGCILSAPLALEQHSACVTFLNKCLFWIVRCSMRVLCLWETNTVYLLNRGSRVDSEADSDLFCNSFTPLNASFAGRLCGKAISPQYWLLHEYSWLLHEYSLHWPFFEMPREPRFLG